MLVRQTPLLLYEQSTPAPKNPSAQVRQELAQVRRCAEKMGACATEIGLIQHGFHLGTTPLGESLYEKFYLLCAAKDRRYRVGILSRTWTHVYHD